MFIVKRSGKRERFDGDKIRVVLEKANQSVSEQDRISKIVINNIVEKVEKLADEHERMFTVDDIQDAIEEYLININKYKLARSYIKHRYMKQLASDKYTEMMDTIANKIACKDVQNQNANVDEKSFGGRIGETASLIMKQFALDYCVSPTTRENHLNNEVYIHDLDAYAVGSHNCLSIPFDKLLQEGFNTRQTDVRPANSVNTAMQLVAVIFQLQSLQQFGGVSATHLDWTMVPYIRRSFSKHFKDGMEITLFKWWKLFKSSRNYEPPKELEFENETVKKLRFRRAYKYALKMTIKETHQAVEALFHNLNTLQSRSGNQLPFTSVNLGTCTSPEGRLLSREMLTVCRQGLGKFHKTSIFPCVIFQCMKGVNRKKGEPNYDLFRLALKCTAERLYPNYANVDWSGNKGYDVNDPKTYFSTMGCRTANGWDINAEEGVNPQTKDGRGNICPSTIILPTLAMEAGRDVRKFMKLLNIKLDECKDSLIDRFNWISSQSSDSAKFMYENGTMEWYHPEEGIRSALKHGTLAVGMLGMAETLELLVGCNQTKPEGMELAKKICNLYKTKCAQYKEQYRLNFGVYFTPAENLCYTAMNKFKQTYGVIPRVSDHDYFTNSIHVPVWEKVDAFEKIDIESQLTGYSSAGCITYTELDASVRNNIDAIEELVNYAMDKDVPYYAINVPVDLCTCCGYEGEINSDCCPKCGGIKIQRLRRVTGYLTGDYSTAFNYGKQKEVEDRVKHTGVSILGN